MNGDQHTLKETVALMAQSHATMIQKRSNLQSIGRMLIGFSCGLLISYLLRIVIFGYHTFHWWDWYFMGLDFVALGVVVWAYRANSRWLRAHQAAYKAMIGVTTAPPCSNLQQHHFDQAQAALDDLMKLAQKKESSKPNKTT